MSTSSFKNRDAAFAADHVLFWTNLSRLNGVLVILNISMFFLTGLEVEASKPVKRLAK